MNVGQKFPGKLIALEGIDGAGKSTIAAQVMRLLQEDGLDGFVTREPGGTPGGVAIRELLSSGACRSVPASEYLLFAADRLLHMEQLVIPALQRGKIVISDRMGDSSYAYQGYGRGVSVDMIQQINEWAMRGVKPDITVYLMIDYATASQRISGRGVDGLGYDQEKIAFFQRVAQGYEALYAGRTDVMRIDARLPIDTIAQAIHQRVCALMSAEHGS